MSWSAGLLSELGCGADVVDLSEVRRRLCGGKGAVCVSFNWKLGSLEELFSNGTGAKLSA